MNRLSKMSEGAEASEKTLESLDSEPHGLTCEQQMLHSLFEQLDLGEDAVARLRQTPLESWRSQWATPWVEQFLQAHPQFFEGKEALLSSMLLSHPQTGEAVSLLERQLGVLRARSQTYESQVSQYLDHAAANTETFEKIETFSANLMRAQSPQAAVDCIYQQMQWLFAVDESSLHSFEMPNHSVDGLKQLGLNNRWSNALAATLKANRPICGAVEQEWRQGLFYQYDNIASVCLVPLGEKQIWGVLALGSLGLKFTGNETLFLKFIGKMITAKLECLFEN